MWHYLGIYKVAVISESFAIPKADGVISGECKPLELPF